MFGVAAIVTLLPGQADFLGYMYAFGAMLSFTIAHVAVMRLRATEPDFHRPYRGPGQHPGARLRPAAVRGLRRVRHVGRVRRDRGPAPRGRRRRLRLAGRSACCSTWPTAAARGWTSRSTHKVAIPQPVVDHEAEYDSVLVPVFDGRYDETCSPPPPSSPPASGAASTCSSLVTVPSALPIKAAMADEEAQAQSAIEQARSRAAAGSPATARRSAPGQAGRRIIEEATDMRAAAIVMALPDASPGALAVRARRSRPCSPERPCRVVIESTPDGGARARGRVMMEKASIET